MLKIKIPTVRKLLIEKIYKEKLYKLEDIYIFELLDKKDNINDCFLIYSSYFPKIDIDYENQEGVYKFIGSKWAPIDVIFLENIGKQNGKNLNKWIKDVFINNKNKTKKIKIYTCKSNYTRSKEYFILYGSLIKELFQYHEFYNNKFGLSIKFNHCEFVV